MEHDNPKRSQSRSSGHVFDDGRLVELCFAKDEGRTYFVIGNHEGHEPADQIRLTNDSTLIPIAPQNNLIHHRVVVLPEKVAVSGTPEELSHDIEAFMDRYVVLSESFRLVASTYVLLSWLYDRFNELPYLRFRGDFGTGKTRALSVIGSLLYKAFFASGASTVSPIFQILDSFRGSLVLDEADFRFSDERAELSKILNNGNVRGFPVLRQTVNIKKEFDPRAFQVFGPKLIACRRSFEDPALESRFLTEDMGFVAVPDSVPLRMPENWTVDAQVLRNRLLGYRLRFRHTIDVDAALPRDSRSARTNQIIGPLLAVAATERHREAIQSHATQLDTQVRTDRGASLDAALVEVIASMATTTGDAIPVSDICSAFAANASADSLRSITPKYTGELIRKRLHLSTIRVGGKYVVPSAEFTKIIVLAQRYGIELADHRILESGL